MKSLFAAALVTTSMLVSIPTYAGWDGYYVGVNLGKGKDSSPSQDFVNAAISLDIDKVDGSLYGIQVGRNWLYNDLMFGVEADWSHSNIDGSDPCPNPTFTCSLEVKDLYSIRARFGKPFGALLPFVTGGIAGGEVEATASPDVFSYAPDSQSHHGWVYGAGVEYAVAEKIKIKGEVLKYNMGSERYYKGVSDESKIDIDPLVLRVGLNYFF